MYFIWINRETEGDNQLRARLRNRENRPRTVFLAAFGYRQAMHSITSRDVEPTTTAVRMAGSTPMSLSYAGISSRQVDQLLDQLLRRSRVIQPEALRDIYDSQ